MGSRPGSNLCFLSDSDLAHHRIAGIAPRSSLIITDEALSPETGKGTDFVVLLSGEPQGGIKSRRRSPGTEFAGIV
jgi:hypothetical protein